MQRVLPISVRVLSLTALVTLFTLMASGQSGRSTGDPTEAVKLNVARLRSEIRQTDEDIRKLTARLPGLKQELEELLTKLESVQPPDKEKPEEAADAKPAAREVEFRPPLSRESKKETNLGIVCRDRRLYFLDFDAMGKSIETAKAAGNWLGIVESLGKLEVGGGDYDIRVTSVLRLPTGNQVQIIPTIEAAPKSGSVGESEEQSRSPSSEFLTRLGKLDPSKSILQFVVLPDSYDTFREARAAAWGRKFDVGWKPLQVGKPLVIGGGPASAQ